MIFLNFFSQESNTSGPLLNRLKSVKWFCWKIRFCEDIQILSSNFFLWQASPLKRWQKMLGHVPIYFLKHLIFSIKARRGLQRQNWFRQNSSQCLHGVWLRVVLVNFGLPKNQHVGHSFSEISVKKIVWLRAVFICT